MCLVTFKVQPFGLFSARKQGSVVIGYFVLSVTTNINMLQCQRYKHEFQPLTIRAFNSTTGFQLLRSPKSGLIKEDLSHGSWWCHVDYPQIDTQTVLRAWASWLLNARSPTSLMQIANLARKQYTVEIFFDEKLMFVCSFTVLEVLMEVWMSVPSCWLPSKWYTNCTESLS